MRAASSPDLQVRFCIDRYPCRFPGPRSAGLSTSSTVLYQVGNVASSAIGDCQGSYRRGPMVPGHRHGPQASVTKLNDWADVVLGLTWLGHLDVPNIYLIILSPPWKYYMKFLEEEL
ncbi:hypothetical protein B296_00050726 [Ensete ventricosum]|uniref:Uncharacterized protein n=1 Tax=Ensete ventricosum TaxID=4639 RepID=A0A426YAS4_ENSVE|nr:hypothetical protein B296_00050726 [Ensete ventricosum]